MSALNVVQILSVLALLSWGLLALTLWWSRERAELEAKTIYANTQSRQKFYDAWDRSAITSRRVQADYRRLARPMTARQECVPVLRQSVGRRR